MIYKFKHKFASAGIDPQVTGEELERIRLANAGQLKTEQVVNEAANPTSSLHPFFTWDDTLAARQWRLAQAQILIRNVVIVKEEDGSEVKAFHSIKVSVSDGSASAEPYYQSSAVLARSPNEYASALNHALQRLSGCEHTLEELQELAPKAHKITVHKAGAHVMEAGRLLRVSSVS